MSIFMYNVLIIILINMQTSPLFKIVNDEIADVTMAIIWKAVKREVPQMKVTFCKV